MMRKWMLLCVVLLLSGCGSSKAEFQKLTPAEAKSRMKDDVVILDVRTMEEYKSGHIEHAVNIPLDTIEEIKNQVQDKEVEILVYCRSGN